MILIKLLRAEIHHLYNIFLQNFKVSQMVAHILRPATVHNDLAGHSHHTATHSPPSAPRDAARHVLLHHDRLAQLPAREDRLLATHGDAHLPDVRRETAHRRHEMGCQNRIDHQHTHKHTR